VRAAANRDVSDWQIVEDMRTLRIETIRAPQGCEGRKAEIWKLKWETNPERRMRSANYCRHKKSVRTYDQGARFQVAPLVGWWRAYRDRRGRCAGDRRA